MKLSGFSLKYPGIFLGLYSSKLLWPQSFAGISLRTWLVLVLNYASELTCSLCSITSHYPYHKPLKVIVIIIRVMELGDCKLSQRSSGSNLVSVTRLTNNESLSHIQWKWFCISQGQLLIPWKALLESSLFQCLTGVRFFSAFKQPWWTSYHV